MLPNTEAKAPIKRDRLLRLDAVENLVGLRKSTIYKLMSAEAIEQRFPASIQISARSVAWSEAAILQWIQDRIVLGRDAGAAK